MHQLGLSGVWPVCQSGQCAESRIGETLEALVLSLPRFRIAQGVCPIDNLELSFAGSGRAIAPQGRC